MVVENNPSLPVVRIGDIVGEGDGEPSVLVVLSSREQVIPAADSEHYVLVVAMRCSRSERRQANTPQSRSWPYATANFTDAVSIATRRAVAQPPTSHCRTSTLTKYKGKSNVAGRNQHSYRSIVIDS